MFKKIDIILDTELKKIILIFFFVISIISLLEILSITLLIPLISVILNEDLITDFVSSNLQFLKQYSNTQVVISLLSLVGLAYFIKAVFLIIFSWMQYFYVAKLEARLSKSLYSYYLIRPYNFFTKVNSAELIRNITEEVNKFTHYIINNGLTLFLEIIIIIFMSSFLFIFNPKITLYLIIFCLIISIIMLRITKKKVMKWSNERQLHSKMKIQHIQEGISGIKEIKILGKEDFFLNYFDKHNERYTKISQFFNIVTNLPRIILEFLAILLFILIITTSYVSGSANDEILVTIGVFSAAAFRLIPAFNRLNVGYQNLRFGLPTIDTLYSEKVSLLKNFGKKTLNNKNKNIEDKEIFKDKIEIKNVSFSYDDKKILNDLNLEIKKNSIIGLVGESGSGKSTLVDILIGLHEFEYGKILVDNIDISKLGRSWQNIIGYVPQNLYLLDDSLKKNIALGVDDNLIDNEKIINCIKLSQLDQFIFNDLRDGLETNIGERGIRLSGGQKQRIGIARALYKNPEILVFDEATSALDFETEKKILDTIYSIKDKTIVIVSHRLSTLKICDNIYKLSKGIIKNT